MRQLATAVCLALLLPLSSFGAETLRIAMGEEDGAVELRGRALAFGPDAEELAFTALSRDRVEVKLSGGKLLIDGAAVPFDAVRFRAGEFGADAGTPGREGIRAGALTVRGDVVIRPRGSRLLLVNVIPLEDYLVAVLGSEMPKSFPLEALKAQAVAARTYALRKKIETFGSEYHLGSSVLSQVYGGMDREDPRTRQAVEGTRGEVLTYDLEPIEAYFHASCGGHTESGLSALNRDLPYLKSVECPCGSLPSSRWALTMKDRELERALGTDTPNVAVVSRSATGRARRVRVGPERTMDAVQFREKLGYTRLKSLDFDVEREGDVVRFTGRGYGHGAGMCQWGAKAYADRGWTYRQILDHYYPGAELQRVY